MLRSVVFVALGAIAGGAAVRLVADPRFEALFRGDTAAAVPAGVAEMQAAPAPDKRRVVTDLPPRVPESGPRTDGGMAAARVAVYEQAAATSDTSELERLIREVAARPVSRLRNLRLGALLGRYSELAPAGAARFARRMYLDGELLAPLFEHWARSDPDAAIAELASIAPPATQRSLALAVLGAIGHDEDSIERVAGALPASDRASFEVDALASLAATNAAAALAAIVARGQNLMLSAAVPRIAEAAVRRDPAAAMAEALTIGDYDLQQNYARAVLDAWAELDPDGAFAWLERADGNDIPQFSAAFSTLASADPGRMLDLVDTFPASVQRNARTMAVQALAEQDLQSALLLYESMPPGQDKDSAVGAIAQAYGRQDPEAALAWARGLNPSVSQIAIAVALRGLASQSVDRAIDFVLAEIDSAAQANGVTAATNLSLILSLTSSLDVEFGRVADKLVEIQNPRMSSILSGAISNWSRNDSAAALDWTIANAERLDPRAFTSLAQQMALQDATLATSTLDRLPPARRGSWLEGIAAVLARNDVDAALSLVQRYRGQPGYDTAYAHVAGAMAQFDPVRAANMLSNVSEPQARLAAAFNVARQWTSQDPAAAARWAAEFPDEQVRRQALTIVAQTWATQDAAAAKDWMLGLANGPARDQAIDSYLSATSAQGEFDPQLLGAYSSAEAAQRGAGRAIVQIGRNDPDAARQLLDTYITDETVRRETEENLARTAGSGGNSVFLSSGGVIVL
jgi:hypothetical protein